MKPKKSEHGFARILLTFLFIAIGFVTFQSRPPADKLKLDLAAEMSSRYEVPADRLEALNLEIIDFATARKKCANVSGVSFCGCAFPDGRVYVNKWCPRCIVSAHEFLHQVSKLKYGTIDSDHEKFSYTLEAIKTCL